MYPSLSLCHGCNSAWVLGTALCLHPFRPVVKAFEKPSSVASPWGPRHPSWVSLTLTIRACFSRVQRFATSWTIACQAPLSMGFSRQENWSVLPFATPGDLPDPGIEPVSLVSPLLASRFFTTSDTWEAPIHPKHTHFPKDSANLSREKEVQGVRR